MSTLRQWLDEAGFDWNNGTLLFQPVGEDAYSPGWAGEDNLEETQVIDSKHPILDEEFSSGYGAPQCPRFFARDENAIYYPGQYDGATWLEKTIVNPEYYIGNKKPTPYPGG